MQLTKQTTLSIELLTLCAVSGSATQVVTLGHAAKVLGTTRDYLSQLMKLLVQHGFVVGQRGRFGGIHLARPASQIALLDVLLKLEPKLGGSKPQIADRAAVSSDNPQTIVLESVMQNATLAFYEALRGVTLHHLAVKAGHCEAYGYVSLDALLSKAKVIQPAYDVSSKKQCPPQTVKAASPLQPDARQSI